MPARSDVLLDLSGRGAILGGYQLLRRLACGRLSSRSLLPFPLFPFSVHGAPPIGTSAQVLPPA